MPKIKFTQPYQVKGTTFVRQRQNRPPLLGHEQDSPKYEAGQEVEVTPDMARKFINRGVAVELTDKGAERPRQAARVSVEDRPRVAQEPKPEQKSESK